VSQVILALQILLVLHFHEMEETDTQVKNATL